jgi:hypothetical protein
VGAVTFPSGVSITNDVANPDDSFICMTCHQGRESKSTIDAAIAAATYSFKNVHYLPAGAILYGSQAVVAYEYDSKTYASKFNHFGSSSAQCAFCHKIEAQEHSFEATLKAECAGCHVGAATVEDIRLNRVTDYDGDGNNTERLEDEISALASALYAQIQDYADTVLGKAIVYDGSEHPYFFIDTNGNGVRDAGEDDKYDAWDGTLMKAAHNYQIFVKETGAWAHNTNYIAQLLIDSIEDLGGNIASFHRP